MVSFGGLEGCAGAIGFDSTYQIRAGFSYRMPYELQLAGSVREATGLPQTRVFVVTTSVVPGLTQVTQGVNAAPRGDFLSLFSKRGRAALIVTTRATPGR